jgi:acetolactate synthase-1/2/3 large subunit
MNGAELLCRCLEEAGGEVIFGVPGTQSVTLFEALRRSSLRTVLTTQELSAAFMANGYARASGRPGLLTTIPGPGFTCAMTGLMEARHDSAPLLLVVPRPRGFPDRRYDLQAMDHEAMASQALKESVRADSADSIPAATRRALAATLEGEPGPVLLEVSTAALEDEVPAAHPAVQESSAGAPEESEGTRGAPEGGGDGGDPPELEKAVEHLAEARRLLLLLGQGALGAADRVEELLEASGALVVTNSSGRGIVSEEDPRCICGDFSGWAVNEVNELVDAADRVLALGCKFSHNGSAGYRLRISREKLVHVDTSREVLNGNYPAAAAVKMDADLFLRRLLASLGDASPCPVGWSAQETEAWKRSVEERRRASARDFPRLAGGGRVGMEEVLGRVRDSLPRGALLTVDSGLHQSVVRRLFSVRAGERMILPSDFQSVGFGLPAGMGAALAAPDRPVMAAVGDGGMAMMGMELMTAVREGLALTVLLFNDGHLGLVRNQQLREFGHVHGTRIGALDFSALAAATGAHSVTVDAVNLDELERVLREPQGVTLVELLLADAPGTRRARVRTLARSTGKRVLGPSLARRLKSWALRVLPGMGGRRG